MAQPYISRIIVAAPQGIAGKLQAILAGAQIEPDAVCVTGEEALAVMDAQPALLLTTWRLTDMTGAQLAEKAGEQANVLMIVPPDYDPASEGCENAMPLRNPISPDALACAVRTMAFCGGKMHALRAKAQKLEQKLEDRKVIERAKGKLMDTLHLSESQAHYHMQKKSMDTGKRIVDIAREILEAEEIAAV